MKRKIVTILAYTLLVVVILLMSQCEGSVTLTTVKRDAHHIIELASQIESEEDLKAVEKLATQYEIGYERAYNKAKSLEFKRLTEQALLEASAACEDIHAENERRAEINNRFHNALNDLDAAWNYDVTTVEGDVKRIQNNNDQISKLSADKAKLEGEIEALADKLIEANYQPEMLAELGVLRDQIDALNAQIADIENDNRIIRFTYKLHGVELPAGAHARMLPAEEPTPTEEATSEEVTTEETTSEGDKVE